MTGANLGADLGDPTVQDALNEPMRYFRQHAPAMLNDEIRNGLTSTIDINLGFRNEYLLDLIIEEAVNLVVQRLATDHPFRRRHETVVSGSAGARLETLPALPADRPNPALPAHRGSD
jgi:hypothetical protein